MYCTTAANPPLSGFEVRTEQTVDYYVVTAQMRRVELVADFGVVGKSAFFQALDVGEAFFRKGTFYVEQIDFYRIVFQEEDAGYSQCVAPIVARTGKYDKTV